MLLLTTAGHPQLLEHRHPHLGRLVTPSHYWRVADTAHEGFPWGVDNDAFNGGLDREKFAHLLGLVEGLPGCRFVACPDVVGDARATAEKFSEWWHSISSRGLPVALVLQDGVEELGVPWDKIAALFIGGTDEFKLGPVAADLAREGKQRGKWVHMGRVNSMMRIRYAAGLGCDSFDGTKYAKWRDTHLPKGLAAAESASRQGSFPI